MFAEERQDKIVAYLKKKKRADINELIEKFQVTGATLRSDLRYLEKKELIVRTHGGALYKEDVLQKENFLSQRTENQAEKRLIAKKALEYIKSGDVIILDSGSTVLELARLLVGQSDIKVITNDLQIALELQNNSTLEIYLIGGRVRNQFQLTQGPTGIDYLKGISANKVFLSPNSLSVQYGVTTTTEELKALKGQMIASADEAYMLCDSSKVGKRSMFQFADVDQFSYMITDQGMNQSDLERIRDQGVEVILV